MLKRFKENLSRIKLQGKGYLQKFRELSVMKKVLVILIALLLVPNLPIVVMLIIPFVMSLFIIDDNLKGTRRGVMSFVLSTIAQISLLFMLLGPLDFSQAGDIMDLAIIIQITISGILVLAPGYIIGYVIYGISYKKQDGKIYLSLIGILLLLLAVWNTYTVLAG